MNSFLNLEKYLIVQKIGEGTFGIVFKVKEKDTNNYFAAKVTKNEISDEKKVDDHREELYYEVNLMAKFNHPAVLQFIGYSPTDFEGSSNPTIITHLAINGTLRDVINLESQGQSPEGWDFSKKLINIYGISVGMQYLHKNNSIHRDLKPENIFMDEFYFPKIADFGLSKPITPIGMSMIFKSNGVQKGTPIYLPPEINLEKTKTSTKAGDVYAFSLIVYEILTNEVPFTSFNDLYKKINSGDRPEIPSFVPEQYQNLIERCWSEEPEKRPTFDEIVDELTNENGYITELVDESEFLDYKFYIEETKSTFNENSQRFHFEDIVRRRKAKTSDASLYPQSLFESLSDQSKQLVLEAETNAHKQFLVGKNLVEGIPPFQPNTQLGIKYLTKSIESGNSEATFYYCRMLIEGDLIPEDLELSRSLLSESSIVEEPEASVLLGQIAYKEKKFELAKDHFIKASKKGNGESMYLYASMLMKGEGVAIDNDEALRYFTLAIKNGYDEKPLQIKVPSVPAPEDPSEKQAKVELDKMKKETKRVPSKRIVNDEKIKFVIVGDNVDGCKVSFMMVLNDKPLPERYLPSLYENYQITIEFEGNKYTFCVWDTAGQDEYVGLRQLSYAGASVIGLTFPMTSRSSFINIDKKWIPEINLHCKDAAKVLIGLCLDEVIIGIPNHVTIEEAENYANENGLDGFIACSARTGQGIDNVFPTLLRILESKNKDYFSCIIA